MNELFTNFGLRYSGKYIKARQGPNTDIMRAIRISDSEPLIEHTSQQEEAPKNQSIAAEVVVSTRTPDYRAKYKSYAHFWCMERN
jgi:CRISPR-associated protein Csm5